MARSIESMPLDLNNLPEAVRREGGISRRLFMAYVASLSTIPWLGRRTAAATRAVAFADDPFTLGVASGDPTPSGVVLWTRLAPKPLEPGGGLQPENFEVTWELASDEAMRQIVARGSAVATPQLAHSVHVEVENLLPDRWYWYRFRIGDAESPVGRTRTMPAADSSPAELRFTFASCQNYEQGLYTAYEHMMQEEIDLVFHLGDYIYENAGKQGGVRRHLGKEIESLDEYRIRYAQYRSDPLLSGMHARCPWIVTWDDHEVDNDYANDISEIPGVDPVQFLMRRANAYQAYYEMMPLRASAVPRGPHMQLYRKFSFGRLAEFLVLDTRQYRTDQPHDGEKHEIDEKAMSPQATMLGRKQWNWLQGALLQSPAHWNVLAQQVMMAMVSLIAGQPPRYSMDKWPGYAHERERLLQFLAERRIANPVVLTGDIHSNWVNDLRVDDRQPELPVVATEFVGTSISSDGNGAETPARTAAVAAENPCVRFHNGERGYVRCIVTPEAWRSDYRVVPEILRPGGPILTRASFVVESGRPGAVRA